MGLEMGGKMVRNIKSFVSGLTELKKTSVAMETTLETLAKIDVATLNGSPSFFSKVVNKTLRNIMDVYLLIGYSMS